MKQIYFSHFKRDQYATKNKEIKGYVIDNINFYNTNNYDISDYDIKLWAGTPKDDNMLIQIFNAPFRMRNDFLEDNPELWNYWNGCVFIDVDSKDYVGPYKESLILHSNQHDHMTQNFFNWLTTDEGAKYNFYFAQRSASGNSWHFVFYYDCEKTEENFNKAWAYSCLVIKKMFYAQQGKKIYNEETGRYIKTVYPARDIIETKGVLDEATKKKCQGIYMSWGHTDPESNEIAWHKVWFNDQIENIKDDFGNSDNMLEMDVSEKLNDIEFDSSDIQLNLASSISLTTKKIPATSWNHYRRIALISVLKNMFHNDKQACWNVYSEIIPIMVSSGGTNQTEVSLKTLFNNQFKGIDSSILQKSMLDWCSKYLVGFKYINTKKFVPEQIQHSYYNKIFDLNNLPHDKQYLSSVIHDIINIPSNIIHVEAGCGVGKTFSADEISNPIRMYNTDDIASLFDMSPESKVKRICFITPMTSINKDNFTGTKFNHWKIIDSEHRDNKKYLHNKEYNICTTWDSFIKRNMDSPELEFDIYIFDEIHSLYMYDYRTEIIPQIISKIHFIGARKNSKVLLFTGTPSQEINEFKEAKFVLVKKNLHPVPTNVVFYNEQFMGYLVDDIKSWRNLSPDNKVAIFNDTTNLKFKEDLEKRGISIDFIYNSQFIENIQYTQYNHDFGGNSAAVSVKGQAGINIKTTSPTRIYIFSEEANSIIQYANRFRNREYINSINIFYPKVKINNKFPNWNELYHYQTSLEDMKQLIEEANLIYRDSTPQTRYLIQNKFNIKFQAYIDFIDDKLNLNSNKFLMYNKINATKEYESYMQVIYNRLIQSFFQPNFVYLDDDIKDSYDTKFRGKFSGVMIQYHGFLFDLVSNISQEELSDNPGQDSNYCFLNLNQINISNSPVDKAREALRKICDGETKKYLEYIVNNTDPITWRQFIQQCINTKGTVCKTNIKEFKEILDIHKHINEAPDNFILYLLNKKREIRIQENNDLTTNDIAELSAIYTVTLCKNHRIRKETKVSMVNETYELIKKLNSYINKYQWYIDFNKVQKYNEDDFKVCNSELELFKAEFNELFSECMKNHIQGKVGGKVGRKVQYQGKVYDSILELSKQLGKTKMTVHRWIKSGKVTYV